MILSHENAYLTTLKLPCACHESIKVVELEFHAFLTSALLTSEWSAPPSIHLTPFTNFIISH